MNRTIAGRIGSLVTVGLAGPATLTTAGPVPTLKVVLQVSSHESVPVHVVAQAKPEMTRIFRDAGATVAWSDVAARANPPDPLHAPQISDRGFALVVLPHAAAARLTVAGDALGGAAGTPEYRSRLAYVFYDRVERIARTYLSTGRRLGTYDVDIAIVLAHAMAHEIGHLLLPYGHSAAGVMRADWNAADLRRAVRGQLNFTVEQGASIRAKLLS